MIGISACIAGKKCRYDKGHNLNRKIIQTLNQQKKKLIKVCPEMMGGLRVPRLPAEIQMGDGFDVLSGISQVFDRSGKLVTDNFIKGSRKAFTKIKNRVEYVIVKENSPACGYKHIYNGKFEKKLKKGAGVFTALLLKNKIKIISDEQFK